MALFEVKNLTKSFGGLKAVNNVSFDIKEREILSLIGPNGAGKTTIFNLISGVYKSDLGKIILEGEELNNLKPFEICNKGIGRTFQLMQPFYTMTTLENVTAGALFGRGKKISIKEAKKKASYFCDLVGLSHKINTESAQLTAVERKKLELARTLAVKPKLLLLDEVMAGLNPTEISEAVKLIQKIREKEKIAVFLIEHIMKVVMTISERVIVLHHGEKISEGTCEEVANDKKVIDAYLGEELQEEGR